MSTPATPAPFAGRAWLVEMIISGVPVWWSISPLAEDEHWTSNPQQATRFARAVDAQALIDYYGWTEVVPTEHMWSDARPYVPALIRNESAGFTEFVTEDVPTVTGQMFARNVEPIFRASDRALLGFRVWDGAGQILGAPLTSTPAEEAGWQLVPKEPTLEMLRKGAARVRDFLSKGGQYPRTHSMYSAMLAAAPHPTDTALNPDGGA